MYILTYTVKIFFTKCSSIIFLISCFLCYIQIEEGEIFATINQKDGMVIFHDDPEKYNSPNMLKKLEDEVYSLLLSVINVYRLHMSKIFMQQIFPFLKC